MSKTTTPDARTFMGKLLGRPVPDFLWAGFFSSLTKDLAAVAMNRKPKYQFHLLEATKGTGKTTAIAAALAYAMQYSPRRLELRIGAGDLEQAGEVRRAFNEFQATTQLAATFQVDNWQIQAGHSSAIIGSSDHRTAHGSRPHVSFLDELVHHKDEQFCETMIANGLKQKNAVVIIATNAGFLNTWAWHKVQALKDDDGTNYCRYGQPAPWLTPDQLRRLESVLSKSAYKRLYKGEWVLGSGDALDADDIGAAVIENGPMDPEGDWVFYGGLDLATRRDTSAIVIVGLKDGRLRLARVERWTPKGSVFGKQIVMRDVLDKLVELSNHYRLVKVFDDGRDDTFRQDAMHAGVPLELFSFGAGNQTAAAGALLSAFKERRITLYRDEQLLSELGTLKLIERGLTDLRIEAPRTATSHGDSALSLMLACLAAQRYPQTPWGADAFQIGPPSMVARAPAGVFASKDEYNYSSGGVKPPRREEPESFVYDW